MYRSPAFGMKSFDPAWLRPEPPSVFRPAWSPLASSWADLVTGLDAPKALEALVRAQALPADWAPSTARSFAPPGAPPREALRAPAKPATMSPSMRALRPRDQLAVIGLSALTTGLVSLLAGAGKHRGPGDALLRMAQGAAGGAGLAASGDDQDLIAQSLGLKVARRARSLPPTPWALLTLAALGEHRARIESLAGEVGRRLHLGHPARVCWHVVGEVRAEDLWDGPATASTPWEPMRDLWQLGVAVSHVGPESVSVVVPGWSEG